MFRPGWKVWVALFVLVGAVAAVWFLEVGPGLEHASWQQRVRRDMWSLRMKRPVEVPQDQWECLVDWTLNLHANCATVRSWVDPDAMWPFVEELEKRLDGPVTIGTIDWIWDEYARFCARGRQYVENYRPTRPPPLAPLWSAENAKLPHPFHRPIQPDTFERALYPMP